MHLSFSCLVPSREVKGKKRATRFQPPGSTLRRTRSAHAPTRPPSYGWERHPFLSGEVRRAANEVRRGTTRHDEARRRLPTFDGERYSAPPRHPHHFPAPPIIAPRHSPRPRRGERRRNENEAWTRARDERARIATHDHESRIHLVPLSRHSYLAASSRTTTRLPPTLHSRRAPVAASPSPPGR